MSDSIKKPESNFDLQGSNNAPSYLQKLFEYNAQLLEEQDLETSYSDMFFKYFKVIERSTLCDVDNFDAIRDQNATNYDAWIKRRKDLLKVYINFLRFCNLSPNRFKEPSIELSKGVFDSLKSEYSKNIIVYSKYANTLGSAKGVELHDITIRDGVPCFKLQNFEGRPPIILPLNINVYDRYYIHNPYSDKEAKTYEKLVANPDLTVIYGLYGFSKDEGIDEKIEELKYLKSYIPNSQFFELRGETQKIGEYHVGLIYKPKNKNRH